MENKHRLKLIDGEFLPSDAGKVLFELLKSKINYHQMEKFSNEERYGSDLKNSMARVEQLKETVKKLEEIILYSSEKGINLKIESVIEITFLD